MLNYCEKLKYYERNVENIAGHLLEQYLLTTISLVGYVLRNAIYNHPSLIYKRVNLFETDVILGSYYVLSSGTLLQI